MGFGSRRRKRPKLVAVASVAAFVLVGAGAFIFVKASETESVLSANRTEAAAHTPAPITAPPTSAQPKLNGVSTALKNATGAFVIGVLGDSTGNGPDEWVGQMAQTLAAETNRRVEFINYNPQASRYAEKRVYGPETAPVKIYNVGIPGATTDEMSERFDGLFPEPPSLIVASVGHNQLPPDVSRDMDKFTQSIKKQWPATQVLIVGQNPATGERWERQKKTVTTLMTWCRYWGFPSVSVFEAIAETPNFESLYVDLLHVNEAGSTIWARVVQRYLLDDA